MIDLRLPLVQDGLMREVLRQIQDFANALPVGPASFQACEIAVTGNVSNAKLAHKLGGVPKDALISRLIAPSAARLTFRYSDFTKDEIVYDVSGLVDGETLHARFLIGTFPDVLTVGTVPTGSASQEIRSKF